MNPPTPIRSGRAPRRTDRIAWAVSFPLLVALTAALRADLPTGFEVATILDDFNNQTVFDATWDPRLGGKSVGYNTAAALQLGTDGAKSVLKILGQKQLTSGFPFTCGGVISKEVLGYGYYEVSAKLPLETGWHCSFWLASTLLDANNQPLDSNEIDAPEIDTGPSAPGAGNGRAAVFNTHYWPRPVAPAKLNHIGWGLDYVDRDPDDESRTETFEVDTSSGYHRYGFEWTPTSISFYVNGALKAQTRYPGPHFATNQAQISMLAFNHGGVGVQAPATMFVDNFKFYRRNYGFPGWNSTALNVALPIGDSTFAPSLVALDPDLAKYTSGTPRVIASNDFSGDAHWDFPASTVAASGRYEVFVWNPSAFSASSYSPDISDAPVEIGTNNPGGMLLGYTLGGDTVVVDSVYGGQSWIGLGARAFFGATTNAITLAPASGFAPNPLWAIRAGPAVFRPLTRYDDFSSGTLGAAWSIVLGSWSASAGDAATTGAGEAVLLRTIADGTYTDGLVRARISSGGATSAGLVARSTASGYYLLRINYAANKLGILRNNGGTFTTLADVTLPAGISLTSALDTVFVLKNTGANVDLLGFLDGRPIAAVIDTAPGSAFTGAGQAGARGYGGVAHFDNFGAGN